ncbi:MAG: transcription termination factor NusA [Kiritimatiellae bacterium]|nr:transcription termination factor NusA [Kiritimatiellia bacterium]
MATNNDLLAIVNYIERERGVDREVVLGAIEKAVKKAADRNNPNVTNDLRVAIDRKTLTLHVYDTKVVSDEDVGPGYISVARARRLKPDAAEGDTIEIEIPAAKLGRIVAAATRQGITDAIREAERDNTFIEYKNRIGEIVSGQVTAEHHRDLYVLVGKTEMLLPGKERIPMEEFKSGDSIRAIIDKVRDPDDTSKRSNSFSAHNPAVLLSRSSPEFVRTLFRLEVSEIADGVVEIMGIARDAGYRTKIAVRTHDDKVDPVGACVGLKGARVRNIVRELNGEKIDIVRWSEDMKNYVTQALAPAKLESVEVDVARGSVHATVAPGEYSKAIGKRGQNVRLTSKLTGWHVEVTKAMSLASFEDQKAEAIKNLAETFSVSTAVATQLADAGFLTVDGIVESDEEGFIASTGLDEVTAKGLYAAAQAVAELTAQADGEEYEG